MTNLNTQRVKSALKMTVRGCWAMYENAEHMAEVIIGLKQHEELTEAEIREVVRLEFWRCKKNEYFSTQ